MHIEKIAPQQTLAKRQKTLGLGKTVEQMQLPNDEYADHFGLFLDQHLVSVVSVIYVQHVSQFRKFSTDPKFQNMGYGSRLLDFIIKYCTQKNQIELWCNARITAQEFYKRKGLRAVGLPFKKGNIEYIKMSLNLIEQSF